MFSVRPCDIQVTHQHAEQISRVTMESQTRESCLESAGVWANSAVYCPDDGFCGQELDAVKTDELSFLENKTCNIYVNDVSSCDNLGESSELADVDECVHRNETCGENAGVCVNVVNQGFNCTCSSEYDLVAHETERIVTCVSCLPGFRWEQNSCFEINECGEGLHNCDLSPDLYCLNYPTSFVCVPEPLKSLDIFHYVSEDYRPPITFCNTSHWYCDCDKNTMVANYNGSNFCLNSFFLPGGNTNIFPSCNASCCSRDCDFIQPIGGFANSVQEGNPLNHTWDGQVDTSYHSMERIGDVTVLTVDLDMGARFVVNSISLKNREDWCGHRDFICVKRLNGLTVDVCEDSGLTVCERCGQFSGADNRWNYLRCDREIPGTWLHLETRTSDYFNIFEVLIHYSKN